MHPHAPDPSSATGRGSAREGRIRGLDGVRALAVLAVIAYHLWPRTLPGGFLGVDVFFVVSGFLITTLLLREMGRRGRLDMPAFWVRRARRLLPALAVVVVGSVVAARVVEPDLLVGIGRQVLGAATFTTNWLEIGAGSSYFDATQPELFQPFWSLAIEEQFYLLWPLALAGLLVALAAARVRAGVRAAAYVVAGAAVLSAVLMAALYVAGEDPTRVYYGTATHAFGLLAGAAAAIAWAGGVRLLPGPRLARWVPVAGLAVLAVLMVTVRAEGAFAYRGGIALGSLAALALVTGCAQGTPAPVLRVLETRPAVWVGDRSYGLYLWHWPVILLVAATFGDVPGSSWQWRTPVVALVLTFALAALSHRYVETPVRRDGLRTVVARVREALRGAASPRRTGARLAAGGAALLVLGAVVVVVTAPSQTSTQRAVEAAQREIEERAAAAPAPDPTAGAPTDDLTTAAAADGSGVSAFGDSVLSAAAPTLFTDLPEIDVDAKPIRKWVDAPALVRSARDAGELRPVVLLNFGTNGGFQFDGSQAAVEETLDLIGPDRHVIIYTVVGYSYWVPEANDELRALVADRPNVEVVDWNGYVAKHAGLLHADRTHPNMDGVAAYSTLLQQSLRELRRG
ncbi:acyltransferase [Cellulomonas sp. DKR-3]|uniref:Acyltransferase n=1 Tax=Cellulomonas fulva TaxID=2835530 RepID=A0ABS5TZ25_9CELL|nr:acyltransferase [Cellulomonas fulva]